MLRLTEAVWGLFEAPRVEGPRVHVREPRWSDARAWVALRRESHAFLRPWEVAWRPEECTRSHYHRQHRGQAVQARDDRGYAFHIVRTADRTLLGAVTVAHVQRGAADSGTLGYWIGAPHARRGYMREALSVLVPALFERLELHRLEAAVVVGNRPSRALLEGLGFRCEGVSRSYLKIDGRWQDHVRYALLATDPFPAPKAAAAPEDRTAPPADRAAPPANGAAPPANGAAPPRPGATP